MKVHGVIELYLKLAILLLVILDKSGLRIGLVVYPMDQSIAIGGDNGAPGAVVYSALNRIHGSFLLAIHCKSLAPKKLNIAINTNEEK